MKTNINRGSALVLVLVALLILSLIGLAALTQTGSEINTAGNFYKDKSTFYAADAGIEFGLAQININSTHPYLVKFEGTSGKNNFRTGRLNDSVQEPKTVKLFTGIKAWKPVGQSIEMGGEMNMEYQNWELAVVAESQVVNNKNRVRKQLQTVVRTMVPNY